MFDEDEAKEILATMVREHSKGGFRRSFKSVNDAKRAKGSARGYGAHRDPSGRFGASKGVGSGKGSENVRTGQSYKISIEALKKKTRCARCHQVGHWHKECPNPAKPKESYYLENESEEASSCTTSTSSTTSLAGRRSLRQLPKARQPRQATF